LLDRDVLAVEEDLAPGGDQELGQEIEHRRLARAVGTDQRVDMPALATQVHVVDRHEAAELLDEVPCLQNVIVIACHLVRGCCRSGVAQSGDYCGKPEWAQTSPGRAGEFSRRARVRPARSTIARRSAGTPRAGGRSARRPPENRSAGS